MFLYNSWAIACCRPLPRLDGEVVVELTNAKQLVPKALATGQGVDASRVAHVAEGLAELWVRVDASI